MRRYRTCSAAVEDSPRRVADLVNISSVAGRVAGKNRGVYNMTKFGLGAFSESLRQEVTKRHVRVSLVEPGLVATELAGHNREEVLETMRTQFSDVQPMQAEDIARRHHLRRYPCTAYPVNEMVIRPTEPE